MLYAMSPEALAYPFLFIAIFFESFVLVTLLSSPAPLPPPPRGGRGRPAPHPPPPRPPRPPPPPPAWGGGAGTQTHIRYRQSPSLSPVTTRKQQRRQPVSRFLLSTIQAISSRLSSLTMAPPTVPRRQSHVLRLVHRYASSTKK